MSVYDAIAESVAERVGRPVEEVAKVFAHRTVFDDYFWNAWDTNVSSATRLFCDVAGIPVPEDE